MKLAKKGGKLMVTNVNENVLEVFEMTGLAGLLNIRWKTRFRAKTVL